MYNIIIRMAGRYKHKHSMEKLSTTFQHHTYVLLLRFFPVKVFNILIYAVLLHTISLYNIHTSVKKLRAITGILKSDTTLFRALMASGQLCSGTATSDSECMAK